MKYNQFSISQSRLIILLGRALIYRPINGKLKIATLDIHYTASDIIKHNNMHFDAIPSNLQNFKTTLETALISKISVIMKVTVLKYGMLCGKGHSIGIPNEMKIATTLPILLKEVGIVVLKKKGKYYRKRVYSF